MAIDAKDACLRVLLKRHCYKHMSFIWMGLYHVFTCLSFGLASACRIYTRFADWELWIIIHNTNPKWWFLNDKPIVHHYIDDFFGGAPKKCEQIVWLQFNSVIQWFDKLGMPTKTSKCKTPRTRLKTLGFEYDTILQKVFIPKCKLARILREIDITLLKRKTTQLELLSLVGKLRCAFVCIHAGPAFVQRMEKAAYSVKQLSTMSQCILSERIYFGGRNNCFTVWQGLNLLTFYVQGIKVMCTF